MRFKQVLRRLINAPMFTAIAVFTLAIGMGANTAIFSVVEGALLRPLPYAHPEELIAVDHIAPGVSIQGTIGAAPFLNYTYREQGRVFQGISMWNSDTDSVTGLAEPQTVDTLDVNYNFLSILGIRPAIGRDFTLGDDSPGTPETVIIGNGYWQSKFGGDASVIGKPLMVNGKPKEIIGVLPRDFWFMDRKPALVLPFRRDRNKTYTGQFSFQSIARLKPGVKIKEAEADMARLIPVALRSFPPPPGYDAKMFVEARLTPVPKPLKQYFIGDVAGVLWVMMGMIGMVLLIACANVANLLLVRAEGRSQELAIRAALGASRGQIAGELLMESIVLGILGGVLGLGLAFGGLRLLLAIVPTNLPRLDQIAIDGPVLLFTLVVSLLGGALFGAIPALKHAGPHVAVALRSGGRTSSQSRERHRTRNTLVVVQVALALVLLIGSGLMIRTFYALKQVKPGFTHPEAVQTFRLFIPAAQVKEEAKVLRMQQDILERLAAIPGVSSTAMTSNVPMTRSGWHDPIFASDKVYEEGKIPAIRSFHFVSPGLLAAMGDPLVAGRDLTWADLYDKRPVAMVSENLARELWGTPAAALGKRIRESKADDWREVVGVVADQREDGLNQPASARVLWPALMSNFGGDPTFVSREVAFIVRVADTGGRSRAGSQTFLEEVRQAVWSVNPNLPLSEVHTLQEIYDKSLARTSFTLVMLGIAGAMALLLGVVGIYGVISYSVTQRTREIGIRMALGATTHKLTRMFVVHGVTLAAIGVACGLAGAAALTRLMSELLFEVRPIDPLTYGFVALGLVAAAVLASYIPASRAASVDPTEALRAE